MLAPCPPSSLLRLDSLLRYRQAAWRVDKTSDEEEDEEGCSGILSLEARRDTDWRNSGLSTTEKQKEI